VHIAHDYRLTGQFEGTGKLYECACGDQVDEAELTTYIDYMKDKAVEDENN